MTKNVLTLLFLCISLMAFAQTPEELKAEKAEKEAQIAALQGEVDAIQGKLDALPGWRYGAFGTIGFTLAGYDQWFSREAPNVTSSTIAFTGNAFANRIEDKYFWRNGANLNLSYIKFDNEDIETDNPEYEPAADNFNLTSLYGYRLNPKLALSGLGEYRTTLTNGTFNNPGFLDLGVGATWTPISELVVVVHPLNYNFVFAEDDISYQSSLGAKIVADYARELPMGVAWRSNLSAFVSYEDASNLTNWTWVNSFGASIWKGLGIGLELGLRGNKQEALAQARETNETITFDTLEDNPTQLYYIIGLTYSL